MQRQSILRRITVECAWATSNTDTFLGQTFCRVQARIGGKKAAVAVAHKILDISFHLLNEGEFYDAGRYDFHEQRERLRRTDRALKTLKRLAYRVQVTLAS